EQPLDQAALRALRNRRVAAVVERDLRRGRTAMIRIMGLERGREHTRELIGTHARPMAYAAGVEVNERRARGRIEADATALHAQPGIADLLKRHARNVEVDRLAEHMLAELRHTLAAPAQHRVGGGRAKAAYDLDRLLGADLLIDFPDQVEQLRIH